MVKIFATLRTYTHELIGIAVGLAYAILYATTAAPTVSFWDCGEFIAAAHGLQVGHAPGSPVYYVLAKTFSLLAMGDITQMAYFINLFSALCSGLTLMFMYWTMQWLLRKVAKNTFVIVIASLTATLTFGFTDSFWFSAVEAEVYALSSLFSAAMIWIAIRWATSATEKSARWLLLLSLVTGLSIGVHWLNLLILPAVVLICYYKHTRITVLGATLTLALSLLLILVLLWLAEGGLFAVAAAADIFCVQTLMLPFGTGVFAVIGCLFIVLIGSLVVSIKYKFRSLQTILFSVFFLLVGYSFIFVPLIRAKAGVPINEGNPRNALMMNDYLNREQYEKPPIIYGACYTAAPAVRFKSDKLKYATVYKLKNKIDGTVAETFSQTDAMAWENSQKNGGITTEYSVIDSSQNTIPVYDDRMCMFFPRMWCTQNAMTEAGYVSWVGEPEETVLIAEDDIRSKPSVRQNLSFFMNYQLYYMYFRYFMWNFAGRFNDAQGFGLFQDGEWISGIPLIDNYQVGDLKNLPPSKESKARNTYYLLPLLLGLLGLLYQLQKDAKSLLITAIIFLFTGIAVVIYVNAYAFQPRERDYTYIMSFYAFSLWIGFGSAAIANGLQKRMKYVAGSAIALLISFAIPILMFAENYDDHNRSGQYTARNYAVSMLESCEPNAILFTNADNDTYPLWYVQNVEGIRKDVRVVHWQLLNVDWYIDQLKTKIYNSDPLPILIDKKQYIGSKNNISYIRGGTRLMDISSALDSLLDESRTIQIGENSFNYLPTNRLKIPLADHRKQSQNNAFMECSLTGYALVKSDLMVLEILAKNQWKRPIYFSPYALNNALGMEEHLLQTGLVYKLDPLKTKQISHSSTKVDTQAMYNNLMHQFQWQGFDSPNIYNDSYNKEMIGQFREATINLAQALIADGEEDKAVEVLDLLMKKIPQHALPVDKNLEQIAYSYGNVGKIYKAHYLFQSILKETEIEIHYYVNLKGMHKTNVRQQMIEAYHRILNIAAFAENRRMETDRIEVSEKIFSLNPSCYEYLRFLSSNFCRTTERANYFSEDLKTILELALRIADFCDSYEESSQADYFYSLYEQYKKYLPNE